MCHDRDRTKARLMRTRQRLLVSLLALAFLSCLAAMAVSVSQQLRQDRLDRALIRAVKALDVAGVERLLGEGASANARDTGEPVGPCTVLHDRPFLRPVVDTAMPG